MTMQTGPGMKRLTAEQVTVTYDWLGRETLLVPDPVAGRMECERRDGWQEERGFNWGRSQLFPAGTWMHQVIATLIGVYAASEIPPAFAGRDREYAERDRLFATRWDDLRASIVGVSDFDPDTRQWRNYRANADLHVGGFAHKARDTTDAYVITG